MPNFTVLEFKNGTFSEIKKTLDAKNVFRHHLDIINDKGKDQKEKGFDDIFKTQSTPDIFYWLTTNSDERCKAIDRENYFDKRYPELENIFLAYVFSIQSALASESPDENIKEITKIFITEVVKYYQDFELKKDHIKQEIESLKECNVKPEDLYPYYNKDKDSDSKISYNIDKTANNLKNDKEESDAVINYCNIKFKTNSKEYKLEGDDNVFSKINVKNIYFGENSKKIKELLQKKLMQFDKMGGASVIFNKNRHLCKNYINKPMPKECIIQAIIMALNVIDDASYRISGKGYEKVSPQTNTLVSSIIQEGTTLIKVNQSINNIAYDILNNTNIPQHLRFGISITNFEENMLVVNPMQKGFIKNFNKNDTKDNRMIHKVSFIASTGSGKTHLLQLMQNYGHKRISLRYPLSESEKFKPGNIGVNDNKIFVEIDDEVPISETYLKNKQDFIAKNLQEIYEKQIERELSNKKTLQIIETHVGATVPDMNNISSANPIKLSTDRKTILNSSPTGSNYDVKIKYKKNTIPDITISKDIPSLFFPYQNYQTIQKKLGEMNKEYTYCYYDILSKKYKTFDLTNNVFEEVKEEKVKELIEDNKLVYIFDHKNYLGANLLKNDLMKIFHVIDDSSRNTTINTSALVQLIGRNRSSSVEKTIIIHHNRDNLSLLDMEIRNNDVIIHDRYKVKNIKPLWRSICNYDPTLNKKWKAICNYKPIPEKFNKRIEFYILNKEDIKSIGCELYKEFKDIMLCESKEDFNKIIEFYILNKKEIESIGCKLYKEFKDIMLYSSKEDLIKNLKSMTNKPNKRSPEEFNKIIEFYKIELEESRKIYSNWYRKEVDHRYKESNETIENSLFSTKNEQSFNISSAIKKKNGKNDRIEKINAERSIDMSFRRLLSMIKEKEYKNKEIIKEVKNINSEYSKIKKYYKLSKSLEVIKDRILPVLDNIDLSVNKPEILKIIVNFNSFFNNKDNKSYKLLIEKMTYFRDIIKDQIRVNWINDRGDNEDNIKKIKLIDEYSKDLNKDFLKNTEDFLNKKQDKKKLAEDVLDNRFKSIKKDIRRQLKLQNKLITSDHEKNRYYKIFRDKLLEEIPESYYCDSELSEKKKIEGAIEKYTLEYLKKETIKKFDAVTSKIKKSELIKNCSVKNITTKGRLSIKIEFKDSIPGFFKRLFKNESVDFSEKNSINIKYKSELSTKEKLKEVKNILCELNKPKNNIAPYKISKKTRAQSL